MPSYISGQQSKRTDCHKDGNYLLAVIGAEEKTSSKGSEMIELKLEVIGPDIEEGQGAILFDYLVFTESAAWKIDQFRRACGENIVEGKEVEVEASDLEGKSVEAHLVIEEFKGKKRNKVGDYINPNAEKDGTEPF
jgi:hypothetical protein